jgi:DNA-binding NarL/FixJ family response regulator
MTVKTNQRLPKGSWRIAIADEHALTRESLFSMILQNEHGCQLVGQAGTPAETLTICRHFTPDLLLLDAHLRGRSSFALVPQIKRISPGIRVLLYCRKADEQDVLSALRAGADGFLEKTCSRSDFLEAMNRLVAGACYLCPKSLNALARSLRGPAEKHSFGQLTPREKEIIAFVVAGNSSKQIAKKLFLSVSTVETHRANLMAKVGARNIAQLIQYALREGLVELPVMPSR